MNKNVMILKDATEITLEGGADIHNVHVAVEDLAALGALWDKLTNNNLKAVHIKSTGGDVIGTYSDMVLCSPAFREVDKTGDGKIIATFGLRAKTEMEILMEKVDAINETLSVHDGAIGDMGAVLSAVAEAQEGGTV